MRLKGLFQTQQPQRKASLPSWYGALQSYVQSPGQPVWSGRNYAKFAEEAYRRNVIAYRAITLIAKGAASVPVLMYGREADGARQEIASHPLLALLSRPNPMQNGSAFWEALYVYRLLSGNVFIQAAGPGGEAPRELHLLRPDRVQVIAGRFGMPQAYRYRVGEETADFPVDPITGASRILHLKDFHPMDDWYGLSPVEAAAYSIDQHNQSAAWNQSLLQNGARPTGALVVKMGEGATGQLSEDQYWRIKQQMDEQFSGAANAGRPLLLEGGLDWREMSLSPKDMDFMEARHAAARDIALAFGVPPQLLGIPGDNTYANLVEARLALWEQTILPLMNGTLEALAGWLAPFYGEALRLEGDTDEISALAPRRESVWERLQKADFLSDDEKRAAVGYGAREF